MSQSWIIGKKGKGQGLIYVGQKPKLHQSLMRMVRTYSSRNKMPKKNKTKQKNKQIFLTTSFASLP